MAGHTPGAGSRVWVSKCKEVRSLACGRARRCIYCLSGAASHLKFMVQPLSQQRFQDPALVSRTTGVTPAIGMQGVAPRPPQPGGSFSSDPCLSHPCRSPAACCKAGLELSSDDSFQMKLPPVVKYEIKKREMWFVLQPSIIRAPWLCPVHVVTYTGVANPLAPSSPRYPLLQVSFSSLHSHTPKREAPKPPKS